ncbi:MAG: hypothetical protein ABFD44_02830 [Anaerolineaceae bacterium]
MNEIDLNATPSPSEAQPSMSTGVVENPDSSGSNPKKTLYIVITVAVILLALLIIGAVFLMRADIATTSRVRDIFIIFMALESMVIGVALVILIVQLATLINLLQNEVKPILDATTETANTLRGTATFISNNLSEPVIKLNEYMAALKKMIDLLHPSRK